MYKSSPFIGNDVRPFCSFSKFNINQVQYVSGYTRVMKCATISKAAVIQINIESAFQGGFNVISHAVEKKKSVQMYLICTYVLHA